MNTQAQRNAQRGVSRIIVIILVSIGAIILLGLIGIYLFTPRLDVARKHMTEATAMAAIRNLTLDQVNYYTTFGDVGYARDLASLGPGPDGKCTGGATSAHACIINAVLGNSTCTGTNWCIQAGYKFNIQGICANGKCTDFVISAAPIDSPDGSRTFCATSDSIVRSQSSMPGSAPLSLQQCQALPAIP